MQSDGISLVSKLPTHPTTTHAIKLLRSTFTNKMRKDGSEPVINHSLRVGILVHEYGGKRECVNAALLHDVLEDTDTQPDEIERQFGVHTLKLLEWVSESNRNDSWEARKENALRKLAAAPTEALLIKAADQIDNIETFIQFVESGRTENPWSIFSRDKTTRLTQWNNVYLLIKEREPRLLILSQYEIIIKRINTLGK